MKVLRSIAMVFLLLAMICSACSRAKSPFTPKKAPHHYHALKSVETLLETNPAQALDSVNALKEQAKSTSFTSLDANELKLREIQAQYKNRCLSEASPDLTSVISFYDSLANLYPDDAEVKYLLANSYYYQAAELAFRNEDVQAFTHYLNALKVVKSQNDWCGNLYVNRFRALIYTRLSEILYRYGINDAAMETCREAFDHYEKDADLAAMKRFEATILQSEKEYDKALDCFQQAEALTPIGDESVQMAIGGKLYELQQYDSAVPHLENAFAKGDRFARIDASAKLAEIYRNRGLVDKEMYFTRFYVDNSMKESRMASRKMEIEYLYKERNKTQEEEIEQNKGFGWPNLLLVLLLLSVIAIMASIITRNRKRITHIESKISTMEQKHVKETAEKDLEIEQITQQLDDTRKQLKTMTNSTFEESWKAFSDSEIAAKIRKSVEGKDIMTKNVDMFPKLKLKEMDFIELVRVANQCFLDFSQHFLKDYPELNTSDMKHGCLALLGINDAEIAVLEGITYSGANRRTKKILSVLNLGDNLEQSMITYIKRNF